MMTFWAKVKKHNSLVKASTVTVWATFGKSWATFYFNIWSRCI